MLQRGERIGEGCLDLLRRREAGAPAELSISEIVQAIESALFPNGRSLDVPGPFIREVYLDRVVVEESDGKTYGYSVKFSEGKAALGEREEVKRAWIPVRESLRTEVFDRIEASGPRKFEIVVIREGYSKNPLRDLPCYWTREALVSGVPVFEGALVSAQKWGANLDHPQGQASRAPKEFATLNVIGTLSGLHVAESAGKAELRATLTLADAAPAIVAEGLAKKWFGFSIDSKAEFREGFRDGRRVMEGVALLGAPDKMILDVVSNPAAGGEVLRAAASALNGGSAMPCQKCGHAHDAAAACTPKAGAGAATATLDPEVQRSRESAAADATATRTAREESERLLRDLRRDAAKRLVEDRVRESRLPEKARAHVLKRFEGAEAAKPEDVDAAIADVRAMLAEVDRSGRVQMSGSGAPAGGMGETEKMALAIERLIVPDHAPKEVLGDLPKRIRESGLVVPFSFKRLIREFTGAEVDDIRGGNSVLRERARESISTSSFTSQWRDVMHKVILAHVGIDRYRSWERVVRYAHFSDFRTKDLVVYGDYGDLPVVGERENYPALSTPTDRREQYQATKKGSTEDYSWESLKNDDVGALQRIPEALGRSYARTLYKSVWNLLAAGQTMLYDTVALFHATHANLGAAALDDTGLKAGIAAMRAQTDFGNSEILDIQPAFLVGPLAFDETIFDLLKPLNDLPGGSTTDRAFVRRFNLDGIIVPEFADTNAWFLVASPADFPGLMVGFMDGRKEPEVFVQDNANLGTLFERDVIVWKIRGVWGVRVADHRGLYKSEAS